MFSVTERCDDCQGESTRIVGHPNDPSAKIVECGFCYDGTVTRKVDGYGTVDEVREDYPKATKIEEAKNV